MKIRIGFVSNSSSSSFVIAGVAVCTDDEEKFAAVLKKEFVNEFLAEYRGDAYEFLNDHGITLEQDDENGEYAGLPLNKMDADETKRQFLARAKNELLKVFDEDLIRDTCFISGCSYNG